MTALGRRTSNGCHNEVDRSWTSCLGLELSVRSGVGTSPWIVSDELWDRLEPLY